MKLKYSNQKLLSNLSVILLLFAGLAFAAVSCKEDECAAGDPTCDLQAAAFYLSILQSQSTSTSFVAVGENGQIWTSTDGLSFMFGRINSPRDISGYPTNYNLNGVAYGNNTYVAVGDFGKILYSTDGLDWTETEAGTPIETTNNNQYHYMDVVYGGDRFIAVGCSPDTVTSPYDTCNTTTAVPVVRWSTDGIYWNNFKTPPTAAVPLTDIMYGNGLFMALNDVTHGTGGTNAYVYQTSTNLWVPHSVTNAYEGIAFGNNRFVLVGASTSPASYLDYTGGEPGTFTAASSAPAVNLLGVHYGNSKYIAVGATGSISQSTAAANWTDSSSGCTANLNAIAFGNTRFISVGKTATPASSACVNEDGSGGSWSEILEGGEGMNRILYPGN